MDIFTNVIKLADNDVENGLQNYDIQKLQGREINALLIPMSRKDDWEKSLTYTKNLLQQMTPNAIIAYY